MMKLQHERNILNCYREHRHYFIFNTKAPSAATAAAISPISSFFSSFLDSSLAMLGDCADGGATIGTALDPGVLGSILLRHHFWNPLLLSLGPRGCLITLGGMPSPEAAKSI